MILFVFLQPPMVVSLYSLVLSYNSFHCVLLFCHALRVEVRLQQECELAGLVHHRVRSECLHPAAPESDCCCGHYNSHLQEAS